MYVNIAVAATDVFQDAIELHIAVQQNKFLLKCNFYYILYTNTSTPKSR